MSQHQKNSLDRWLTTEPEDSYTPYYEEVVERFTESFYEAHEESIVCSDGSIPTWIERMYNKGRSPKEAAMTIERLVRMNANFVNREFGYDLEA